MSLPLPWAACVTLGSLAAHARETQFQWGEGAADTDTRCPRIFSSFPQGLLQQTEGAVSPCLLWLSSTLMISTGGNPHRALENPTWDDGHLAR